MSEEQNNNPPELKLEEVIEVSPEEVSEEQKTFLQENVDNLTDEQKETFKGVLEKEEEEEEEEPQEPQTRIGTKKKEEGEEEEIDPDDEQMVNSIVDKKLKEAGIGDTRDQLEIDSVIRDNPEYSKYREKALKYMKVHPSLVAGDAMRIVTAPHQQKIGAQKEREATEKANATKGGGVTVRKPASGGKDWGKATQKEMEAKKAEIFDRR